MEDAEAENPNNMWETRYGFRVDLLAAFAYLLGPISGSYLHNAVERLLLRHIVLQRSCCLSLRLTMISYAFTVCALSLLRWLLGRSGR